jgi:hypothetical protein
MGIKPIGEKRWCLTTETLQSTGADTVPSPVGMRQQSGLRGWGCSQPVASRGDVAKQGWPCDLEGLVEELMQTERNVPTM